jgi:DNA-binding transcriptional ArsR family regulator
MVRRTRLSQPGVSMHLGCLAGCGLVRWERQGRFVTYELADKGVVRLLDEAEDLVRTVGPLIRACANYRTAGGRRAPSAPVRARRRA